MKKGQCYEGYIDRTEFPDKGILHAEDTKIIVKNGIPGQKVSVMIQKKKKGRAEGRILEILERSPLEKAPYCEHFGICGGCSYQTLPYEAQLDLKSGHVKKLLDQVYENLGREPEYQYEGIRKSPVQFEYRNKMEFSFGDEVKGGDLALGMHKKGSFYDIVPVVNCQIVDEDFRLILTTVLEYFREKNVAFYHRLSHEGYLRHLLVRKARKTGEILIALITTTQLELDLGGFTESLLALEKDGRLSGKIAGILHTKNDSLADVVKSDETVLLYGKEYFYEELLGLRFCISQFSFFQTNSLGAEVLYETAREFIGDLREDGHPDKVVFDLYSGTGTIAQMLAPVSGKVIGVEIVEEAVVAARENAKTNGLHNCEFIAGDVLKVIDDIEDKPDIIVLDPPRDGIHPKALSKIIAYGVDRIVYISCKPTSLARDLEVFLQNGYEMTRAVAVDMFPGTVHCESLCLLQKKHTS